MKPTRVYNPVVVALLINAVLLLGILLALIAPKKSLTPAAYGDPLQQPPIAGGNGVFVMPAQFHDNIWGCYLLDVDRHTLCTYEYVGGQRELRLTSARDFSYDTQLKNFATVPSPWEVQQMVQRDQEGAKGPGGPAPDPEQQAK